MANGKNEASVDAGDGFCSAADVAAAWGVSEQAVRRWARRGLIPVVRTPTGYMRFPRAAMPADQAA